VTVTLLCLQATVQQHRQEFEIYLLHHLAAIPAATDQPHKPAPAAGFRLLRLSGAAASATSLDLLRCIAQPQLLLLQQFNPFLSPAAAQQLQLGMLVWLQLCVLEDRLGRLVQLAAAGPEYTPLLIRVRLYRAIKCTLASELSLLDVLVARHCIWSARGG
jgi:hypothetical protein